MTVLQRIEYHRKNNPYVDEKYKKPDGVGFLFSRDIIFLSPVNRNRDRN